MRSGSGRLKGRSKPGKRRWSTYNGQENRRHDHGRTPGRAQAPQGKPLRPGGHARFHLWEDVRAYRGGKGAEHAAGIRGRVQAPQRADRGDRGAAQGAGRILSFFLNGSGKQECFQLSVVPQILLAEYLKLWYFTLRWNFTFSISIEEGSEE